MAPVIVWEFGRTTVEGPLAVRMTQTFELANGVRERLFEAIKGGFGTKEVIRCVQDSRIRHG